jgi:hypothetical protein
MRHYYWATLIIKKKSIKTCYIFLTVICVYSVPTLLKEHFISFILLCYFYFYFIKYLRENVQIKLCKLSVI